MERISIIIPVYNSSSFLRRCVDSILAQSYKGNKEVILVDDGSTDGSGAICDDYVRKNADVTVYHTENKGASLARRYGLERASGEYVTYVDSDDYVDTDYISVLIYLENKYNLGISACSVSRVNCGQPIQGGSVESDAFVLEKDELFHRFFKYEFWGFWGKLYKRELLMDIPFPTATLSEDYFVMAHLFQKEKRMAYTPVPHYFYEQHEGSLSHQISSPRAFEEFINVRDVYSFTCSQLPEYEMYALSNAVETAVKLLWSKTAVLEKSQRQELAGFLRQHRKDMIQCKPLNRKVALLALLLHA